MSELLTVEQLRAHVETGLPDFALEQIIESEEASINARYGEPATMSEIRIPNGSLVALSRPALSIESVVDGDETLPPEGALASDYYGLLNRTTLERRNSASWSSSVAITYTPASSDVARRLLVLVQLCKLALAYSGYQSQAGADVSETPLELESQRERLLRSLRPGHWLFT